MPKIKKWIQSALEIRPRRKGLKAEGYTPKLHHHATHHKSVRVEAKHKGDLHRWAGVPLSHKFTKAELSLLEGEARRTNNLHALRMVMFAQRARSFKHHSR